MNPLHLFISKACVLLLAFLTISCAPAEANNRLTADAPSLILATTTSTQDSGLLDLLVPIFQEQSGQIVQTVAVGTGAALKMAEEGNADVLLVHAPEAEKELLNAGFAKERWLIMHNDFVIVGPPDDPAAIAGAATAAESFDRIATTQANFLSRGDDSGTHKKELSIWQNIAQQPTSNGDGWYLESGQGMGNSLVIASEKDAYTLTDRATYLAMQKNLNLDILVEGDAVLLNIYHVMTVNPEQWPDTNYDGALQFANYMVSDDVQAIIADFGMDVYGQPLFFPDAGKTVAELGLE